MISQATRILFGISVVQISRFPKTISHLISFSFLFICESWSVTIDKGRRVGVRHFQGLSIFQVSRYYKMKNDSELESEVCYLVLNNLKSLFWKNSLDFLSLSKKKNVLQASVGDSFFETNICHFLAQNWNVRIFRKFDTRKQKNKGLMNKIWTMWKVLTYAVKTSHSVALQKCRRQILRWN